MNKISNRKVLLSSILKKKKWNKKAIELSINFTILLILAIFMFTVGIIITNQIFSDANEMKDTLSEQQREQLERILMEGTEKIKTVYIKKELNPGEHDVFGFGIRNDFDTKKRFYIEQNCDAYIVNNEIMCDDDTADNCDNYDKYLILEDGGFIIEPNERNINDIFITLPKNTEKGTYVYNIRVCYRELGETDTGCIQPSHENQYDTTKKFNIVVN